MNHSPPSPLTRMPNSVPLRAMAVTTVLYSTSPAGSVMALPQAIARPRKIRLWLAMYLRVLITSSLGRSVSAIATAMALANRLEEALWRLCNSSPICKAWVMIGFRSKPPIFSKALRKVGAQTSRHRRSPSNACSL